MGNYRSEIDRDPTDSAPGGIYLTTGGRFYEFDPRDGRDWRDYGPTSGARDAPILGLPAACGFGWTYLGDDLVLNRPAAHLACGLQEFWIDRAWRLVTRAHDHDPLFGDDPGAGLSEVIAVSFGPQPAELFAVPPPDTVRQ